MIENALFESENFWVEKTSDQKMTIHHKSTGTKAVFEPFAAQGIINTIYQQSEHGKEYSESLERIGQTLLSKGGFF